MDKVTASIKQNDLKKIKFFNKVSNFNFNKYNENGDTPALIAIRYNKIEIVRYIFTKVPNLIKEDKTTLGDTGLMIATFNGNLDMIRLLVEEAMLDVNCQDDQGYTPLIAACANNFLEIAYYFIVYAKCNYKKRNYDKQSAVHRAAFHGNTKTLRLLDAATSLNINKKDKRGNTPLHYAAMNFHIQTMRFLLGRVGENCLYEKNNEGIIPLDYVMKNLEKVTKMRNFEHSFTEDQVLEYLDDPDQMPFEIELPKKKKEEAEQSCDDSENNSSPDENESDDDESNK